MASPGFSGFVQGLARSPLGNLPGLMMAKESMADRKEQLAMSKERFAMEKQQAEEDKKINFAAGQTYVQTGGNLRDVEDIYAGLGRTQDALAIRSYREGMEISQSENTRAQDVHSREMDAYDHNLQGNRIARFTQLTSTGNAMGDEPVIDRIIRENPGWFQTEFGLPDYRTPTGAQISVGPNNEPHITISVYNSKTKTQGPITKNASAASDDDVISIPYKKFMGSVNEIAVRGMKKGEGEGKNRYSLTVTEGTADNIILDKVTGKTSRDPKSPKRIHEATGKIIDDTFRANFKNETMLQSIGGQKGLQDVMSSGKVMVDLIVAQGADPRRTANFISSILASNNEYSAAFKDAETVKERNEAMLDILKYSLNQQGGLPPLEQAEDAPGKEPKPDPRSIMPIKPK